MSVSRSDARIGAVVRVWPTAGSRRCVRVAVFIEWAGHRERLSEPEDARDELDDQVDDEEEAELAEEA